MFVEILVLGRDEGVNDILRDVVDRHEDTVLAGVFRDQETVTGMHPAHDRRRVFGQLLVIGQVVRDAHDVDRRRNEADQADHGRRNAAPQRQTHQVTQCEEFHYALWPLYPLDRPVP